MGTGVKAGAHFNSSLTVPDQNPVYPQCEVLGAKAIPRSFRFRSHGQTMGSRAEDRSCRR